MLESMKFWFAKELVALCIFGALIVGALGYAVVKVYIVDPLRERKAKKKK